MIHRQVALTALSAATILSLLRSPGAAAQKEAPPYPPVEQVRTDFLKLLDRPRVELAPVFTAEEEGGLTIEHGVQVGAGRERPNAHRPRNATARSAPGRHLLHGTGRTKETRADLLRALARRGYLAVAIDARHHEERVPGGADGSKQYNDAVIAAWRSKRGIERRYPFWYDTAYDLWRTVDYLLTRPDVDRDRIGTLGFSMGGAEVWLAASVDTRIRVSVPVIAVQSLRWSLDNDRWHGRAHTIAAAHEAAARDMGEPQVNQRVVQALWTKIMPGILGEFDGPSMIRLFAPRPLLILNTENDENCPLPGAELAFDQARAAYAAAGALDRLRIVVLPGMGHEVTPEHLQLAHEWLDRWLQP